MKKSIFNLGKTLNRREQKTIFGGEPPCFEWCADPYLQEIYWKPLYCSCSSRGSGGSGGSGGGGGNDGGPVDPV